MFFCFNLVYLVLHNTNIYFILQIVTHNLFIVYYQFLLVLFSVKVKEKSVVVLTAHTMVSLKLN